MFFTILGCLPYAVMGVVMANMGYNIDSWQFWVILSCMIFIDVINTLKRLLN